jgi:cell division protease FtsH
VQGTFKAKVTYPVGSKTATPTTLFATQVPTFWNGSQLEALLTAKGVEINAQSTTRRRRCWPEILLGFGPTLLIVGIFV